MVAGPVRRTIFQKWYAVEVRRALWIIAMMNGA